MVCASTFDDITINKDRSKNLLVRKSDIKYKKTSVFVNLHRQMVTVWILVFALLNSGWLIESQFL